jgi:hypothetical protein
MASLESTAERIGRTSATSDASRTSDGSISRVRLSAGSFRYRARYRDPGGRQHEKRFPRKVDAQRWLDEAASAMVTQTWTAPARGRVTVADWAARWLDF